MVSVRARMRQPDVVTTRQRQRRPSITPDARPRKAQRRLDILLAHHVIDGGDASAAREDNVPGGIGFALPLLLRNLGNRLAFILLVLGAPGIGQNDTTPASGSFNNVPPAGRTRCDFFLQSIANSRI